MNPEKDNLDLILQPYRDMTMFEDYVLTTPESPGPDDDTPLHIAAFDNDVAALEAMLPFVVNIDVRGGLGYTPLHYAVLHEAVDAARFLIERGAGMEVQGDYDETPLEMMESREKFSELLQWLSRRSGPTG
jgi:ankyrin repeat protein